jgi:hypothetical protein
VVISKLFDIRPDVKVVLETAEEKDDNTVKEALRKGVYLYLQKPIRFENIKQTMKTIEEEEIVPNALFHENAYTAIGAHLAYKTVISLARLAEDTNLDEKQLMEYLKELESNSKIVFVQDIKEISCNVCNSVRIKQFFQCPACKSSNFDQSRLIEHFKCGNVSKEVDYKNSTCPKCKKEIKVIGVDYRTFDNFYQCTNCQDRFSEPVSVYHCGKCDNRFTIEKAKMNASKAFKVIN